MNTLPTFANLLFLTAAITAAWTARGNDEPAREIENESSASWTPQKQGLLAADQLPEASGLVASSKHKDLFWTHNDSNEHPGVMAIKLDGRIKAHFATPKKDQIDWEGLALDERYGLVVGDFGDNLRRRKALHLYFLPEPDPEKPATPITEFKKLKFMYPKDVGAIDAEGLVVRSGKAYVFSKEPDRLRVFEISIPDEIPDHPVEAKPIAETRKWSICTGADLSPDGRQLALLTYLKVAVIDLAKIWPAQPDSAKPDGNGIFEGQWHVHPLHIGQAEGIAWRAGDLWIVTEKAPLFGSSGALWKLPLADHRK